MPGILKHIAHHGHSHNDKKTVEVNINTNGHHNQPQYGHHNQPHHDHHNDHHNGHHNQQHNQPHHGHHNQPYNNHHNQPNVTINITTNDRHHGHGHGHGNVYHPRYVLQTEIPQGHYVHHEYHPNGNLKIEGVKSADGKFNGRYYRFHENGKIEIKAFKKNDDFKKDKTYEKYDFHGKKVLTLY